ncbi:MAG TPA: tetratricopeptide repeat protein [Pyrinomonadaceae bacterium]|nr:tetratricopeptide repeat protein [Pyrinomonadaceae bacterium]
MRFFGVITLLGLASFTAFAQTTKPKTIIPVKAVKKAGPVKTTTATKPKPTPKNAAAAKTTVKNSSTAKPKPTTTSHPIKTSAASKTTANKSSVSKAKPQTTSPPAKKPSSAATTAGTKPKPKPAAAKSTATHTSSPTKPKPSATPPKRLDEKTEWETASNVPDAAERVTALRKFTSTFPTSDKRNDALELISATRGQIGNEKLAAGDLSGAAAMFKLAASEAPKPMSDALFTESLSKFPPNLFFRGERDAAYDIAKTLEEKADTNVSQLLGIANFYMSIENGGEAKRLAESAIKLNPDSSPAWQTLGLANRMEFVLDDAADAYAKALAIEPDSLPARRGLAEMKRSLGKADEAVTLYREILAKDAENLPAQTGLILSLFDAEKRTDAEAELARSLQANSGNVILLAGVAYWYAAHSEGDKAVDYAQRSIAADPRLIWSHIALARGLMIQKKPVEAEKALLAARQYGAFPTLEYEIASARLAAGFYKDAGDVLAKTFSVKDGLVSTKLGGRVQRESKSFIELVGPERRASIFAPTAADDPENAARLAALLEFRQQLDAAEPKADAVTTAADTFMRGDDKMKIHRQIFVATQMLDKKVALPKVIEITKSSVLSLDAGLDTQSATAATLASELYEPRAIAFARGDFLAVPDVARATLQSILRGRVEEIAGWAMYEMDDPTDSVLRLRRAVSVLPADSAWWRSSVWRLGSALALSGKNAEAIEAYIKCYKSSGNTPDAARYAVIESLYKKVNGTTDGLAARIGEKPESTAAIAQRSETKPAAEFKTDVPAETKIQPAASATPEIKIDLPKPVTIPPELVAKKVEPKPTPELKIEPAATPTPEIKIDVPKPEPAPTPELKADAPAKTEAAPTSTKATKIDLPKTEPTSTPTPETKIDAPKPEPTPTPELKSDAPAKTAATATPTPETKIDAPKPEPTPATELKTEPPPKTKMGVVVTDMAGTKINEPKADLTAISSPEIRNNLQKTEPTPTPELKTDTTAKSKIGVVVTDMPGTKITDPKTEAATAPDTPPKTKPEVIVAPMPDVPKPGDKPMVSESKLVSGPGELFPPVVIKIPPPDTSKAAIQDTAGESKSDAGMPEKKSATSSPDSRPRVVDPKPTAEIKPCIITSSEETLSLKNGGSDLAVIIGTDGDNDLEALTATSNSPRNVSVHREMIEGITSRAIFVVRSITGNTGMYQIKFEMPCGKKEVLVKVK